MANKKPTGPESPVTAEHESKPPEEHIEIGQLRTKHNITRAIFVGVCAAQGWKPGKRVTDAEFLKAVQAFTSAPMSGAARRGAKSAASDQAPASEATEKEAAK